MSVYDQREEGNKNSTINFGYASQHSITLVKRDRTNFEKNEKYYNIKPGRAIGCVRNGSIPQSFFPDIRKDGHTLF